MVEEFLLQTRWSTYKSSAVVVVVVAAAAAAAVALPFGADAMASTVSSPPV